jgi:hypothetical protein
MGQAPWLDIWLKDGPEHLMPGDALRDLPDPRLQGGEYVGHKLVSPRVSRHRVGDGLLSSPEDYLR